jgi:hypothetical protein
VELWASPLDLISCILFYFHSESSVKNMNKQPAYAHTKISDMAVEFSVQSLKSVCFYVFLPTQLPFYLVVNPSLNMLFLSIYI